VSGGPAKRKQAARKFAEDQRQIAVEQRDLADKRRVEADRQRRISLSRQFATQATTFLVNNQIDSALLYAVQALRTDNNFDTRDSLLSSLEQSPNLVTFLRGHTGGLNAPEVHDVAFHPGGRILASAGEDRRVILWDVQARRRLLQELVLHPSNAIRRVVFSPDGEHLATLGLDGAWVWKTVDGAPVAKLNGRHGELTTLAFSPDGEHIATGDCIRIVERRCAEGQVMLWSSRTGGAHLRPLLSNNGEINAVAFHPNGKMVASANSDGTVQRWDWQAEQRIGDPLRGHTRSVLTVAFSPDGQLVASAGADRTIRLWNSSTGEGRGEPLIGHNGAVTSLAFSPDGSVIASAGEDKTIRLWQVKTGVPVGEPIVGHRHRVNSVVFSPTGQFLASGGRDNMVMLVEPGISSPIATLLDNVKGGARAHVFSPDVNLLASGSSSGIIKIWDVAQRRQFRELTVASGSRQTRDAGGRITGVDSSHLFIEALAFHPRRSILASGSLDGSLDLWDVTRGDRFGKRIRHPGELRSVAFSPDGKLVASAGARASIRLWDSQQSVAVLKGHREEEPGVNAPNVLPVYSLAFSPDGRTLASGSFDRTIILWDVAAKKRRRDPLTGHEAWVNSVAFAPSGQVLASADVNGVILLWDVATGNRLPSPLRMPTKGYTRIAFSPDGKFLAAAGQSQLVMLWDLASREPVAHPFRGPIGQVETIAFSPDGKTIATGDFSGRVLIWDVSLESWSARACKKANRNFSANEWAHVAPNTVYKEICPELPFHASVIEQILERAKVAGEARHLRATQLYKEAAHRAMQTQDAGLNNRICWFGSIDGFSREVLPACDRAVELAPLDGGWRDTRGVARALLGDLPGALADFQFFMQWAKDKPSFQRYLTKRQQWAAELIAGRSPFDPETLKALRTEP
jgi:WD40 repeat protein